MSDEIKTGDVVTLKSGGPEMTVNGFSSDHSNMAECVWFDGNVLREGAFYIDTLTAWNVGDRCVRERDTGR
jgi:uncharacterized protein YodC (DUF2158 family)